MKKADLIQQAINRASLTTNVAEDVAKALKQAELHPALAVVIMRIHDAQMQMEKEIRELRSNMLMLAQVVEKGTTVTVATHEAISRLGARSGVDMATLFGPEDDTPVN